MVQYQTSVFVSMAGVDDNVVIIGDWVPPSPSPRTFLSAMLGDDIGSRSVSEPPSTNKTENIFLDVTLVNETDSVSWVVEDTRLLHQPCRR